MTRALLQWSDIRPTLLRAVGRSGVEYRIEQIENHPTFKWRLFRFITPDDAGVMISTGWLVDMKALAAAHEADALGPVPLPQRIAWDKLRPGHYWGVAPCGLAYRIQKIGSEWRVDRFENADAEYGTILDEGSLAAMKAAAGRDATAATATLETAP